VPVPETTLESHLVALDEERAWFLWDDRSTIGEFREALQAAPPAERARLLGKLLREAPDPLVWQFTTVAEVRASFSQIERYLGRRRAFWRYLLDAWQRHGIA
jgi:hypothetical protein